MLAYIPYMDPMGIDVFSSKRPTIINRLYVSFEPLLLALLGKEGQEAIHPRRGSEAAAPSGAVSSCSREGPLASDGLDPGCTGCGEFIGPKNSML